MASKGGQNGAEKQFKYQVHKQPPINRPYLDPARDKVVRGGEYELLGTGCLWRRQDHLPSSSSIWAGQDELLFGRSRGVHCGDYLDLLSCLLICYNLQDTTWKPLCVVCLQICALAFAHAGSAPGGDHWNQCWSKIYCDG